MVIIIRKSNTLQVDLFWFVFFVFFFGFQQKSLEKFLIKVLEFLSICLKWYYKYYLHISYVKRKLNILKDFSRLMNTLFELKGHHITICIPKNLKHSVTKKPNHSITRFIRNKKHFNQTFLYIWLNQCIRFPVLCSDCIFISNVSY